MKDAITTIEKGDVAAYFGLNDILKKELHRNVEAGTAQAPDVYKEAVKDTMNGLCEAMDSFSETEKETVVSPLTWRQYVTNNKEAIDKSLKDLGVLVGATATDAKEAVTHQAEKVFELTEKVVRAIDDSADYFRKARELLVDRDREAKESMSRISEIMLDLNELPKKDMPDEAKDAFAKMHLESMEMLEHFQSLYDVAHKPSGKMIPGKVAELFDVAQTSLKNVHNDLKVCACMKKAAVKEQAASVFGFIAKTAGKITSRAKDYMKALKTAKDKIYSKGQDIADKLQHLKPVLVVGITDDRDSRLSRYLCNASLIGPSPPNSPLTQLIMKEMMKDGLGKKEIQDAFKHLGKTFKDAANDKNMMKQLDQGER